MNQESRLRHLALAPLGAVGRVDSITMRITASIRLGLMVDGEQLPSETELANKLQVSTVSLRESLSQLRAMGLIETRRGRNGGSFVRYRPDASPEAVTRTLSNLSTTEWRDLGEEHLAVSGRISWLAARRASASDIDRLFGLVNELPAARTVVDRQRADSRFHIGLAVVAQSERLTNAEVRLQNNTIELVWATPALPMDPTRVANEHKAIVKAVASHDQEAARREAEGHVRRNMQRIIQLSLEALSQDAPQLVRGEGVTA